VNSIQKLFVQAMKETFRVEKIAPHLVAKRFKELGIRLNEQQLSAIESQLRDFKGEIKLQIEDDQISVAGFASEAAAQDAVNSTFKKLIPDIEKYRKTFPDIIGNIINQIVTKVSDKILRSLKHQAKQMLRDKYADLSSFETRLYKKWGKALDLLELHLMLTLEAGGDFNSEFRSSAAASNDYIFEALTRLHARACQITSEILCLLRSGHADGAHARWRTLHEISVVSSFIVQNSNDLAEAYLLHEGIETYKAAEQFQRYCKVLGYKRLTKREFTKIESRRQHLINRFGKEYGTQYGWATLAIKNRPTMKEIEKATGLAHVRPFYKMASQNVHANPRSVFFRLGLYPEIRDILLAGPSDAGLSDPGSWTAISLNQVTAALLLREPILDNIIICDILIKLSREIDQKFSEIEQRINKKSLENYNKRKNA
jgi:hypothetical protein